VSWGTKGSDKNEALPSLKSKTSLGADAPTVEDTTNTQEDVDAAFQETVTRALTKVEENTSREKPTMDDDNKTFRTRLVAAWMLSNARLARYHEPQHHRKVHPQVVGRHGIEAERLFLHFALLHIWACFRSLPRGTFFCFFWLRTNR
jgi:hypothetical protein